MLKKESKLNAEDLLKLKKQGKRVFSTLFSVTYLPEKTSKYAVTCPKKVYKNAVDRNRAKRRVFSVISKITPQNKGFYEFFVKNDINSLKIDEIRSEIVRILCPKS